MTLATDPAPPDRLVADPSADDGRAPAAPPQPPSARPALTGEQVWRAAKLPLTVLFVLAMLMLLIIIIGTPPHRGQLDPDAAGRTGSRAVAQLLEDRGVDVRRSTSVPAGASGTLLVARADLLTPDALTRLVQGTPAANIVLVGAEGLTALGVEAVTGEAHQVRPRQPGCNLPVATVAGVASMGGEVYAAQGDGVRTCYAAAGRPSLAQVVRGRSTVTLLGTGEPLTNDRLDEEGNAALALGLLSQHSTVDWVMHSPASAAEDNAADKSVAELLPVVVAWLQLQLLLAAAVAAVWRARRLGPIVAEALPVVVRAAESVEGRGRLYAAGRAHDRAGDALRSGARGRLSQALALAPDASPDQVVEAVSARSRRDTAVVGDLLYGPPPSDDESLVRLASELDSLDSEVRRT